MAKQNLRVMKHEGYSDGTTYTVAADNYQAGPHGVALSAVFHLDREQAEALLLDLKIALDEVPVETA